MNTKSEQDDHGGHDKTTVIIVNTIEKKVTGKEISFDQVVRLAFDPVPTGPNIEITITYRRGDGNKPEGTLLEGSSVKIKEGMIFNATATDKS